MLQVKVKNNNIDSALRLIKRKIKDVSKDVVDSAKKILSTVMKRISEAFDYILKLGEQMLQGFLNFFGLSISNVAVEGGGKYPLL